MSRKTKISGFISINEINELCNIKTWYIRDAIDKKELDFYRFGNKTKYIKVDDFERWIESKKNQPIEQIPILRMKNLKREGV